MPLYVVRDRRERPLYIVADDLSHAVDQWRAVMALENKILVEDVEEPDGITRICDDSALVICGHLQVPDDRT